MMRATLWVLACLTAPAVNAAAQSVPPAGRIEVGIGVDWVGQATLGTSDATETTSAGTPSRLFSTSSALTGVAGFQAHIGVRATKRLEAEVLASRSKPTIRTTISNDIETSTPATATEDITQYVVGAGVLWYVPLRRGSSKLAPFVSGGVAYLRQLHEGDTLAVTGQMYRVGGGVKYFFPARGPSWFKGYGVRADAGVAVRVKGVAFDSGARYSPAAAASLFVRF